MESNTHKSSISFMNLDQDMDDWIMYQFEYALMDLQHGLKYLSFITKPNDYTRGD